MHTDFRAEGVNWITNQIKSCPVSLSSLEFLISRSSHSMLDVVLKREPNFEIQMNWFLKRSHHSLSMHISLMRKNGIYIDRTPSGDNKSLHSNTEKKHYIQHPSRKWKAIWDKGYLFPAHETNYNSHSHSRMFRYLWYDGTCTKSLASSSSGGAPLSSLSDFSDSSPVTI